MKAYPYVNDGRWIVDCPSPTCASASLAAKGRKTMKCVCRDDTVCDHKAPCGKRWDLQWPDPDEVARIEAVLALRPRRDAKGRTPRNWHPGETVDLLIAENIEHGIGAP
jgi:hypothetical protein